MSRQLKPQIVDEVRSANDLVRLPVYFDRNEKDFYVEVTGLGDRVRADSVIEVKRLARELLAKAVAFKWEGIITIKLEDTYEKKYAHNYQGQRFGTSIKFEFDRMERSQHPTRHEKEFVYRQHTIDFEESDPNDWHRKRRDRSEELKRYYSQMGDVVLPYDEETWAGLHAMKRAIDEAHAKLEVLIERKDLIDRLRLVGKQAAMPILPAAVSK
jgi:hypothetical protein